MFLRIRVSESGLSRFRNCGFLGLQTGRYKSTPGTSFSFSFVQSVRDVIDDELSFPWSNIPERCVGTVCGYGIVETATREVASFLCGVATPARPTLECAAERQQGAAHSRWRLRQVRSSSFGTRGRRTLWNSGVTSPPSHQGPSLARLPPRSVECIRFHKRHGRRNHSNDTICYLSRRSLFAKICRVSCVVWTVRSLTFQAREL